MINPQILFQTFSLGISAITVQKRCLRRRRQSFMHTVNNKIGALIGRTLRKTRMKAKVSAMGLIYDNRNPIAVGRSDKYLRIYQSSSPSYLLMAGIDSCMELVEREGERRLEELLCNRKKLVQKLNSLKHIRIYPSIAETGRICEDDPESFDVSLQEPGKLLISARGTGLEGRRLSDILRERYHLEMEMSGADYVIAILTMMDRSEGYERLRRALTEIDQSLIAESDKRGEWTPYQKIQPVAVTKMSDAFMSQSIWMSFDEAAGRTAADFVNIYPPGIPVLVPGERVEAEVLEMLAAYRNNGYTVQGIRENSGYYIKTVRI